jgi:hypothetical protein
MADFDREGVNNPTEEPTIGSDTKPNMYQRLRSQSWFGTAVKVIAAVIIIVIIVFGVRAIHHHFQNNDNKTVPANTKKLPNQPPTEQDKSKSSDSKKSGNNNSSGNSSGTASGPSLKSGQEMPNTGPGDVVAIFLGASFLAAGLHYALELRRNS